MVWSWQLSAVERAALTSRQFIRYHLICHGLGNDLAHVITGKVTRRAIAPPEEILALFPELVTA
jgi:hypothetical protein